MPLTTPMSFREALAYLLRKKALPTNATSAEISQWGAALRDSSLFSAQTPFLDYLEDIRMAVRGDDFIFCPTVRVWTTWAGG